MRLLLLLSVLTLLSFRPTHEYNLARFEIRPKGDSIELYVKVDRLDILTALQKTCKDYNYLDQCFEEYFNEHTSFLFDGTERTPKHNSHLFTDNFIEISFKVDQNPQNIKEVKVYSDLLFEVSDKQENIVFSLLNDKRRSFRMNKDRKEISIKY